MAILFLYYICCPVCFSSAQSALQNWNYINILFQGQAEGYAGLFSLFLYLKQAIIPPDNYFTYKLRLQTWRGSFFTHTINLILEFLYHFSYFLVSLNLPITLIRLIVVMDRQVLWCARVKSKMTSCKPSRRLISDISKVLFFVVFFWSI